MGNYGKPIGAIMLFGTVAVPYPYVAATVATAVIGVLLMLRLLLPTRFPRR